jgi:hypothetical protein
MSERLEEISHSHALNQHLRRVILSPPTVHFKHRLETNKHSHKLMAPARQQFCGDTVNIFGREDQNFQWSRAYSYYSSPSTQNEIIWTSGIARAGCVPKVFDCKELVSWCADKYISGQRIIPLRDHSLFLCHLRSSARC